MKYKLVLSAPVTDIVWCELKKRFFFFWYRKIDGRAFPVYAIGTPGFLKLRLLGFLIFQKIPRSKCAIVVRCPLPPEISEEIDSLGLKEGGQNG